MSKIGVIGLAGLLLATNLWWLYVVLDQGVTITHHGDAIRDHVRDKQLLASITRDLVLLCGQPDVSARLASKYKTHVVKDEDGFLFIDGVGLRFDNDRLTEVVFMSER